ncbi:MAG: hypothetical protein JRI25_02665 [Deltaproteobacteria bacterium]|nr:hypothetical protein [Deltaproteobacteria bacterium]
MAENDAASKLEMMGRRIKALRLIGRIVLALGVLAPLWVLLLRFAGHPSEEPFAWLAFGVACLLLATVTEQCASVFAGLLDALGAGSREEKG